MIPAAALLVGIGVGAMAGYGWGVAAFGAALVTLAATGRLA